MTEINLAEEETGGNGGGGGETSSVGRASQPEKGFARLRTPLRPYGRDGLHLMSLSAWLGFVQMGPACLKPSSGHYQAPQIPQVQCWICGEHRHLGLQQHTAHGEPQSVGMLQVIAPHARCMESRTLPSKFAMCFKALETIVQGDGRGEFCTMTYYRTGLLMCMSSIRKKWGCSISDIHLQEHIFSMLICAGC